jgi:tryptophan synthase alpha chain
LSRIRQALDSLRGEGGLIAYVMGGDPDIETTGKIVGALVAGGADVVELGIPFSDPIADGRSIQEAGVRALAAGTTPRDVLRLVSRLKKAHDVPIAVMTYYNVLYSRGLDVFMDEARAASVDGIIVPDLPLDETAEYATLARARDLDTILLASPTTSTERMRSLGPARS